MKNIIIIGTGGGLMTFWAKVVPEFLSKSGCRESEEKEGARRDRDHANSYFRSKSTAAPTNEF